MRWNHKLQLACGALLLALPPLTGCGGLTTDSSCSDWRAESEAARAEFIAGLYPPEHRQFVVESVNDDCDDPDASNGLPLPTF